MVFDVVGGAFLSAFLQVLFDRLASRQFLDFFRRRQFDHSLLRRLQTTLLTVNGVLSDAEEKQITNPFVKEWVDELKDAAYQAEDLLDEIATMALECNVRAESQAGSTQVRSNLYTLNKIREDFEDRLENVTRRIEYLTERRDVLGLVKESLSGKPSPRLPTTCLIDESEIYGRDADKEEIMKFLLSGSVNGNGISVISIVGMGGVGKTTLAQLLYNDTRVMTHFSRKIWVYVSEESDVLRVSKTIYENITSQVCNLTDLNLILVRLREKLARERFLIVLDDVWDENLFHWEALKNSFKAGVSGSRILVTTRSQGVASGMHAIFSHCLKQLSNEDCLLVFAKHAFRSDNANASEKLKPIGEKIMEKCRGLPLAAKVLGSLLHSKAEAREWNKILNSKIWDLPSYKSKIIPSLRLSYYYLPPNLKQCFAYCSIFPKGYVFDKEKLVLLWIGEGFLQQPRSDHSRRKEEVGYEYIDELISMSLFEQLSCNKSLLIMHDLVNELAQFVSGEFCFKFESGNRRCISEKARHFSYVIDHRFHGIEKFEALHEAKYLRTFLPLSLSYPDGSHYLNKIVVEELLPTLTCLRVLSLANYTITQLPEDMFDDLIHVRHLDLSSTAIRTLPKSAGFLYNLEVLMLSKCYNLVELPENTCNLVNLSHLDVTETKLEEMPPEFGRLKNLQILTTFVVSKGSGSSMSELGRLPHLYGKLSILELQNVRNVADAANAKLKDKENIKELVFTWKTSGHDTRKETDILEKLRPHENIEKLTIEKYGGRKFPGWLGNSSFSNTVYLRLSGCKNCLSLPSLGQLSSLEELRIDKMERLESIGPEFYGNAFSISPFKSLKNLWFEDLPNWKHWSSFVAFGQGFPSLQELHIRKCQHLTGSLPSSLPSLKLLHIYQCRSLRIQFQDMMHCMELQTLHITSSCDSLTFFSLDLANKVENLQIQDCCHLRLIQVSKDLSQELKFLQDLEISDCEDLEFFSGRGMQTPNLASLSVSNCKNLRSMPEQMHTVTSLRALCLSYCPKLESFPNGGLPPNLHSLLIESCDHLTPQKYWGLDKMASLTCLTIIGGCSDLKSFPEEGLLPASLISLQVGELPKLEILNLKGLQFLTSLKGLHINNCIKLHCLSEGRLPSSLSSLAITGCLFLSERCQENRGEDWPKISHITNKVIDGKVM